MLELQAEVTRTELLGYHIAWVVMSEEKAIQLLEESGLPGENANRDLQVSTPYGVVHVAIAPVDDFIIPFIDR